MNVSVKQSQNYSVRQINCFEDTYALIDLGRQFVAEATQEEIDDERILESAVYVRSDDLRRNGNVFLVHKYDLPVGFLVGTAGETWYNRRRSAEQHLWFVLKDHRHSIAPKLLIDAFEAWALSVGCSKIQTGCANPRYSETMHKTLTKLGYAHVGGNYVKEF